MACTEFEILLLEYAELAAADRRKADAHVAGCQECREFLDSLATVDSRLSAQFAGRRVSAGFEQAVQRRIRSGASARRPSFIPEVLDFVGWVAIIALLGMALYWVIPQFPVSGETAHAAFSANVVWAAGAAFVFIGLLIGLRSFVDLKH